MRASNDSGSADVSIKGSEDGPFNVNKKSSCNVWGDGSQFKWVVDQENLHLSLNEEEITVVQAASADLDSAAYMEAHALDFKNGLTWAGVAVASPYMPYGVISQPVDYGWIYKGQTFALKEDVVHVVKMFSTKMHQHYFVYKSSKVQTV